MKKIKLQRLAQLRFPKKGVWDLPRTWLPAHHSKASCEARCRSQHSCPAAQTLQLQPEIKDPAHIFLKKKSCLTQPAQEAALAGRTEQSSTADCSDRCRLLCLLAMVCPNGRGSSCLHPHSPGGSWRRRIQPWGFLEWPSTRATCIWLSMGTGQRGARRAAELPGNCPVWLHSPLGTRGLCTAPPAASQVLSAVLGLKVLYICLIRKTTYFPLPLLLPFHPIPLC